MTPARKLQVLRMITLAVEETNNPQRIAGLTRQIGKQFNISLSEINTVMKMTVRELTTEIVEANDGINQIAGRATHRDEGG